MSDILQEVKDAIRQADYECEMAESVQMPFASWTEHQAKAVLAVPAIADALAAAAVRETVDSWGEAVASTRYGMVLLWSIATLQAEEGE